VVEPWIELISRLEDDKAFYAEESERAQRAGEMYHRDSLAPRYVEFFRGVANSAT
jgi:hypothetical protein